MQKRRLRNLRPRLAAAKPRLGYVEGDAKAQDRHRNALSPWRAWYHTERWQRLRLKIFERDAYTCQRTGEVCAGRHPAPNSPVANHVRPHKGDPALFWDEGNLETVTKAVHDGIVQAEERDSEFR